MSSRHFGRRSSAPDGPAARERLDVAPPAGHDDAMTTTKAPMIRLDPALHRALRRRAEDTDRSVTELVNDAVREQLAEDADDLAVIEKRRNEPTRPFATVVAGLRRRGKL